MSIFKKINLALGAHNSFSNIKITNNFKVTIFAKIGATWTLKTVNTWTLF